AAQLRFAARQGHRARSDARARSPSHAPGARRVHHRRHSDEYRFAQAAARSAGGHRGTYDDANGRTADGARAWLGSSTPSLRRSSSGWSDAVVLGRARTDGFAADVFGVEGGGAGGGYGARGASGLAGGADPTTVEDEHV